MKPNGDQDKVWGRSSFLLAKEAIQRFRLLPTPQEKRTRSVFSFLLWLGNREVGIKGISIRKEGNTAFCLTPTQSHSGKV